MVVATARTTPDAPRPYSPLARLVRDLERTKRRRESLLVKLNKADQEIADLRGLIAEVAMRDITLVPA